MGGTGLCGNLADDDQIHSAGEFLQQGHGVAMVDVDEAVTVGLEEEEEKGGRAEERGEEEKRGEER